MSEPKWTPGPWRVEKAAGGWSIVCDEFPNSESPLTKLMDFDDSAEHDAHLIAAAPELYEALIKARSHMVSCPQDFPSECDRSCGQRDWHEVQDALAKARGEEQ